MKKCFIATVQSLYIAYIISYFRLIRLCIRLDWCNLHNLCERPSCVYMLGIVISSFAFWSTWESWWELSSCWGTQQRDIATGSQRTVTKATRMLAKQLTKASPVQTKCSKLCPRHNCPGLRVRSKDNGIGSFSVKRSQIHTARAVELQCLHAPANQL